VKLKINLLTRTAEAGIMCRQAVMWLIRGFRAAMACEKKKPL